MPSTVAATVLCTVTFFLYREMYVTHRELYITVAATVIKKKKKKKTFGNTAFPQQRAGL